MNEFTEVSPAHPTGLRAHSLSGSDQQGLPRKECPTGRRQRDPLQKQQEVVSGLSPPFSPLSGCPRPLALKTELLTLKYTQVTVQAQMKESFQHSFQSLFLEFEDT